jgi:hypothetical protein
LGKASLAASYSTIATSIWPGREADPFVGEKGGCLADMKRRKGTEVGNKSETQVVKKT